MAEFIFYTNDDFISNEITGGTRRFRELVVGLMDKGHHIHLFVPSRANFPSHRNLTRHPVKRKKSRLLPNGLLNFISNYPRLRSIRRMKNSRPVFVSLHYALQGWLAGVKKPVLIVWEDFIEYRKFNMEARKFPPWLIGVVAAVLSWLEGLTLLHMQRIVLQCRYDREVLLRRHPRRANKLKQRMVILPNNVNPSWIKKKIPSPGVFVSSKASSLHVGFIGNVDNRRKGLHLLLQAFERLLNDGKDARLHVIGSGRLLPQYKKKYNRSSFIFHGYRPEPLEQISGFDLLVVPSLADSFPNTIMEALYLGVPVLGARTGGIPEMLLYDELLFEPRPDDLYGKLTKTIGEGSLEYLGELCLRRREAFWFDWPDAMEKKLLE